MTQICKKSFRLNLKRTFLWRVTIFRRYLYSFWNQIIACWIGKNIRYRQLLHADSNILPHTTSLSSRLIINPSRPSLSAAAPDHLHLDSSNLVHLKISLLGDCRIGKTSFLVKYVGEEKRGVESGTGTKGINQMDKTLCVRGARISYNIWEVGGDAYCLDDDSRTPIPAACKDSVAMLFMFDLTSRCTLNSVIRWYQKARKWNQTGIPVMVGTKFDDFVQLPLDMQWTIASEARAYAKALNATLFFSSASYNINVNKIFKFITAKLFNLPWDLEWNLTVGEPIIDF